KSPFAALAAEALKGIDQSAPRAVVIDLRNNGGGDSRVINPLLDGLPERKDKLAGRLTVLVGPHTITSPLINTPPPPRPAGPHPREPAPHDAPPPPAPCPAPVGGRPPRPAGQPRGGDAPLPPPRQRPQGLPFDQALPHGERRRRPDGPRRRDRHGMGRLR